MCKYCLPPLSLARTVIIPPPPLRAAPYCPVHGSCASVCVCVFEAALWYFENGGKQDFFCLISSSISQLSIKKIFATKREKGNIKGGKGANCFSWGGGELLLPPFLFRCWCRRETDRGWVLGCQCAICLRVIYWVLCQLAPTLSNFSNSLPEMTTATIFYTFSTLPPINIIPSI